MPEADATQQYSMRVGERLREIRRQRRLSLQEVESLSGQEIKASVLGAYERGERVVSVPRLHRLALFYGVCCRQLLPADPDPAPRSAHPGIDAGPGPIGSDPDPISIDVAGLGSCPGPEGEMLRRFLGAIGAQRRGFDGRELTVRRSDLAALAAILGTDAAQVAPRLESLGILARL